MTRTFAIGDTHGHHDELISLLARLEQQAEFDLEKDHLVLLGDFVDSGPKVKELIQFCIDLKKKHPDTFHPIYGNHEDLMLDALHPDHPIYGDYYLWWNQGGQATIKSYTPQDLSKYDQSLQQPEDIIPKEHLDFIGDLPLYYEDDKYFYVHGGLQPDVPIKEHNFFDPVIREKILWIRDEFTRSKYKWEKKIIYGHTPYIDYIGAGKSDFAPFVMDNKIGINTMPRHNQGHLTALELPREIFYTIK